MESTKQEILQSSKKQHIYEDCPVKSYVCSDKNCQEMQNINMWPVKPSMDMLLPKPAVPYQYKRLCSDKNCQSTRCFKKKCPVRPMCEDKNCQSAKPMDYETLSEI